MSIAGGNSGYLITCVERKSGYLVAGKMEKATADNINAFTMREFKKIPHGKRLSITYDNGSEFSSIQYNKKPRIYLSANHY